MHQVCKGKLRNVLGMASWQDFIMSREFNFSLLIWEHFAWCASATEQPEPPGDASPCRSPTVRNPQDATLGATTLEEDET